MPGVSDRFAPPAVSLNVDVDTNKELIAHGYSNLFSGILGTVYAHVQDVPSSITHLPLSQAELPCLRQHPAVSTQHSLAQTSTLTVR
jgi:hypothetical protein